MNKGGFFSKIIFLFALLLANASLLAPALLSAQDAAQKFKLYYYGVLTNVNDQNMLNITQDLFFAQLRGIQSLETFDRRDDEIKISYTQIQSDPKCEAFFNSAQEQVSPENSLLFAARVYRPRSDEKWSCAFSVKNLESGEVYSTEKEYDSYYKILTDAKSMIQRVVSQASGGSDEQAASAQKAQAVSGAEASEGGAESLAGSWGGEKNASKIILLRSGRGFIVFNNGATMNVSVFPQEGGASVRIVQRDKFNASFYPDIDRQVILNCAESAFPIEWNLTLSSGGSLVGKKKTLVQNGASVEPASLDVSWVKK